MTKEEKEKILGKLSELIETYNRDITVPYALSLAKDMVQDMPITESKETNLEHYKDEIIENSDYCFALVDGKPCQCSGVSCRECGFSTEYGCSEKIKEWLNKPYEKPVYKLTKFEKELLECYSDVYSFKVFNSLNGMKEKGYFKGIDDNELIGDILANCEVVE